MIIIEVLKRLLGISSPSLSTMNSYVDIAYATFINKEYCEVTIPNKTYVVLFELIGDNIFVLIDKLDNTDLILVGNIYPKENYYFINFLDKKVFNYLIPLLERLLSYE
jgi:hypothetical protein